MIESKFFLKVIEGGAHMTEALVETWISSDQGIKRTFSYNAKNSINVFCNNTWPCLLLNVNRFNRVRSANWNLLVRRHRLPAKSNALGTNPWTGCCFCALLGGFPEASGWLVMFFQSRVFCLLRAWVLCCVDHRIVGGSVSNAGRPILCCCCFELIFGMIE